MTEESMTEVFDDFALAWQRRTEGGVDFQVHLILGRESNGAVLYIDDRTTSPTDAMSLTPVEGGHWLHGDLRFDGTCNITPTNTVMMQFMAPEDGDPLLGRVMRSVYAIGHRVGWWASKGGA